VHISGAAQVRGNPKKKKKKKKKCVGGERKLAIICARRGAYLWEKREGGMDICLDVSSLACLPRCADNFTRSAVIAWSSGPKRSSADIPPPQFVSGSLHT